MKSKPIEQRIGSLDGFAHSCAKALKEILSAMSDADKTRLGALYGGIGFFLGAAGAWFACSSASIGQSAIVAPAIAVACGLIGLRMSYTSEDIRTKKRQTLIAAAVEMRDDEVRVLDDRIKKSRANQSSDLPFLEFKRTALLLASNDQLLVWAGLVEPTQLKRDVEPLQLAPPPATLVALLPSPAAFSAPIAALPAKDKVHA